MGVVPKTLSLARLLLTVLSLLVGYPNLTGAQTVQIVHDFFLSGIFPYASVIEGSDGALYGTTTIGGGSQEGTIFKVNKDGTNFTQLKGFSCSLDLDGCRPFGALIEGTDGYLYGTTSEGGYFRGGSLFRIAKDGSNFALLWIFTCSVLDGCSPFGRMIEGSDGYLYGTTLRSVFKIAKDSSSFVVLKNFQCGQPTDGCESYAGLVKASDGFLYGTSNRGGASDQGTLFKIATDGTAFVILTSFSCASGCNPYGELVEGSDGFLYGTTSNGGNFGGGTLFKVAKDGTKYTILRQFECFGPDGCGSHAGLIEGSDGMLYGTNVWGGAYSQGSVLELAKMGKISRPCEAWTVLPTGVIPIAV